jgi:hypothetical protein
MSVPAPSTPAPAENTDAPAVYIQELCLRHKNIDKSEPRKSVWERPERLRSVQYGVGAILARIEQTQQRRRSFPPPSSSADASHDPLPPPVRIIRSTATDHDMLKNEAARTLLHIKDEEDQDTKDGDMRGWTYAQKLQQWCKDSRRKIGQGLRELPDTFEVDLYRKCCWSSSLSAWYADANVP